MSAFAIQVWHLAVKTIILLHKTVCISKEKIITTNVKNPSEFRE
jgi:hypothetical protein